MDKKEKKKIFESIGINEEDLLQTIRKATANLTKKVIFLESQIQNDETISLLKKAEKTIRRWSRTYQNFRPTKNKVGEEGRLHKILDTHA